MPDIQPIDIALFLVSLAACIYCVQLSRRLKSLQDTRDGLGATIMAMTKSVSAVSSATQETRNQAGELASRLSKLMKEADQTCDRLGDLIDRLEATENVERRAETAPHLAHSDETGDGSLEQLIDEMRARQNRLRNVARGGDFLFEDDDAWVARNTN